jgi:hypothetical protein
MMKVSVLVKKPPALVETRLAHGALYRHSMDLIELLSQLNPSQISIDFISGTISNIIV